VISKIKRFIPIVVLLIAGCSKKEPSFDVDKWPPAPPLLKEFKSGTNGQLNTFSYTYQDRMLVSVEFREPDPGPLGIHKTTLVVDRKITEMRYEYRKDAASALVPLYVFKYEYLGGRLSKRTKSDAATAKSLEVTTYTYDDAGHIKLVVTEKPMDWATVTLEDSVQCDQKGNVLSGIQRVFQDGIFWGQYLWVATYDDKINPRQFLNPEGSASAITEYFSPSNPTSIKPTLGSSGPGSITSYVYNAEGYPVSAVQKNLDGTELQLTFTY